MDLEVKTDIFRNFLNGCYFTKIINDLVVFADDKKVFTRFSDQASTFYGQVHEDRIKVNETGTLLIANTSKLDEALERISSEVIRLKTSDSKYLITDGSKPGKSKIIFSQLGAESFVESFAKIQDLKPLIDIKTRDYIEGKYKFENGYDITLAQLEECLKDAKMFKFESYTFSEKDNVLSCTIEDDNVGESFRRNLITEARHGSSIPAKTTVSKGFRELIGALKRLKYEEKEKSKNIFTMYFNDIGIMITDNKKMFFVLHAVEE